MSLGFPRFLWVFVSKRRIGSVSQGRGQDVDVLTLNERNMNYRIQTSGLNSTQDASLRNRRRHGLGILPTRPTRKGRGSGGGLISTMTH